MRMNLKLSLYMALDPDFVDWRPSRADRGFRFPGQASVPCRFWGRFFPKSATLSKLRAVCLSDHPQAQAERRHEGAQDTARNRR